jgi:hypothetical protein
MERADPRCTYCTARCTPHAVADRGHTVDLILILNFFFVFLFEKVFGRAGRPYSRYVADLMRAPVRQGAAQELKKRCT